MEIHEGEALQNAAKLSRIGIHGLAESMEVPRSTLYYNFKKKQLDPRFKQAAMQALGLSQAQVFSGRFNTLNAELEISGASPGEAMRLRKALGMAQDRS